MTCFAQCDFKKEVSQLRKKLSQAGKELAALDPDRVKEELDKADRRVLRVIGERDCARKRNRELQETVDHLNYKCQTLKDQLEWAKEDLLKEKKEGKAAQKTLKRHVDQLEKKLSTADWKLEKQQKDSEKMLKKALKEKDIECKAKLQEAREKYEKDLSEKDAVIRDLKEQLQKATGGGCGKAEEGKKKTRARVPGTNSSNSSTPPAADQNHKTIISSREPSGLSPGAQDGHKPQPRKKMKADIVILLPPPQACLDDPDAYYKIGEKRKQVISVHMAVSVTEYVGECYRNHKTREVICSEFPDGTGHLEVNYDESVEAFAAFLHSVCNVPYNKIQEFFNEAVEGDPLQISTGKLAGLEKKFSSLSEKERAEIWGRLFCSKVMNIDGTSIRINGKQRQTLVMRSGKTILYKMTGCKGDKAIEGTPAEHYQGTVVCDSESTFTKLGSRRQGCMVHEERYVRHAEEVAEDLTWHKEIRELMTGLQHRRNKDMARGIMEMPEKERREVRERYSRILKKGLLEYGELCGWLLRQQLLSNEKRLLPHAAEYSLDLEAIRQEHNAESEEELDPEVRKALLKDINTLIRLISDRKAYLLFLEDYSIPPHNNDAEKAARTIKVHSKPNGGMRSEEYAGYYADTASVLETEHAHGRSRLGKLKEVFGRGRRADFRKSKCKAAI